ncbi:hypothetical protein BC829DRAFT_403369 [Chytridium lagenaria]|nr:hypothetical protein BC829DRAFT_403369 [Chytridium lagenaria]
MSAPSISAMEVDVQASPQSTLEMIGGGISSRQRRQREAEDDGDSPTKRRRQGSEIQDVVVTTSNEASARQTRKVTWKILVLVNDQPVNEPLETVVPPPAFIENDSDDSGERPSSRSRKPILRQTTLKLRDRAVAGAKHTYRTAIQTRSKTRSSPYAR